MLTTSPGDRRLDTVALEETPRTAGLELSITRSSLSIRARDVLLGAKMTEALARFLLFATSLAPLR
jgi:hypothetical protein